MERIVSRICYQGGILTPIRMIELFAGIGATHEAMTELGIPVEIVGIAEIDRNAVKGYEAIHGPVKNLGDVTKIGRLPDCDLITYSWPCQSVSIAGHQTGMREGSGTTSSLLWEVGRLLDEMRERETRYQRYWSRRTWTPYSISAT